MHDELKRIESFLEVVHCVGTGMGDNLAERI